MNFLGRYRRSEESVICMAGIIMLCVDLCKSDDDFSKEQHSDILDIMAKSDFERKFVADLIIQAEQDVHSHKEHATQLYDILHDQKDFLEMILATLYKLSMVDKVIHQNELKVMCDVSEIFKIRPPKFFIFKRKIFDFLGISM